jgi:DNA-binding response OmpR family regulator
MEDVLVVDDDSMILEMVKQILEREGIVAHCVASGEEALEQIRDRSFSLMITDYNMPGLNGLELSRKGLKLAPLMPIIMDTGSISAQITTLAKEIGISKVLAKPFRPAELMNSIRDVLGAQAAWAVAAA